MLICFVPSNASLTEILLFVLGEIKAVFELTWTVLGEGDENKVGKNTPAAIRDVVPQTAPTVIKISFFILILINKHNYRKIF